jgi:2-phosphosulfolactate phosphatase
VAVVVDVFRAGNTAAALLASGAPFIQPAAGLDQALDLKRIHPDWLAVGERGGLMPPGFDLNNSPALAAGMDLKGRPVVLTTSAGAQGLEAAAGARHLMMATLVNAEAAVRYIRSLAPREVVIVPMGLDAREPAVEDDVAAEYLAALLLEQPVDYKKTARAMLQGPGADRLKRLGQSRDLAYCLRLNYLDLVPAARRTPEGLRLTAVRWFDSMAGFRLDKPSDPDRSSGRIPLKGPR